MVLQQNQRVPIWGKADTGETVTVRFATAISSTSSRSPARIENGTGRTQESWTKTQLKFGRTRCHSLSPCVTPSTTTRGTQTLPTKPACQQLPSEVTIGRDQPTENDNVTGAQASRLPW